MLILNLLTKKFPFFHIVKAMLTLFLVSFLILKSTGVLQDRNLSASPQSIIFNISNLFKEFFYKNKLGNSKSI